MRNKRKGCNVWQKNLRRKHKEEKMTGEREVRQLSLQQDGVFIEFLWTDVTRACNRWIRMVEGAFVSPMFIKLINGLH